MKKEAKQFSQEAAMKIYSQLDKKGQKLLEDEFGKDFFTIVEAYLSFEAACKKFGYDSAAILPYKNPANKLEKVANANMKLYIMREAIGNFPKNNDKKWYPVFRTTSSGLVFSHTLYEVWDALSDALVGAPFVFTTSDEAADFGKNNQELYNEIFTR